VLAIAFDFLARCYHATPWGRRVNEADTGWPPDPWRIARALLCTWHRKVTPAEVPREALGRLLEALAADVPGYEVPPAVHAHTRHFMPTREGRAEKRTLVFDAFARLGPSTRLVAVWENVGLGPEEERALEVLLDRLSYLGRAESWVESCRLPDWSGTLNCRPGNDALAPETGERRDVLTLLAPRPPADYSTLRARTIAQAKERRVAGKEMAQLLATLPDDWLSSLEVETADIRAAGWSDPPGARKVHYTRPAAALQPVAPPTVRRGSREARPTVARYAVYGKPLCRLEDAVRFGERLRRAIMGRAKSVLGEDRLPAVFSRHGPSGHAHAFYLPEAHETAGAGLGGRIHHALVFAEAGFDGDAIAVLDRLRQVAEGDGRSWQVVLEGVGRRESFRTPLLASATEWVSVTPYLHPWHRKPRFDVPEQIRRECRERGLPDVTSLEPVVEVYLGGRARRPIHFHRFRSRPGLVQPDRHGSFWRLRFAEPIRGPLALGFACHFGLGLFEPLRLPDEVSVKGLWAPGGFAS
jgi:CRISPR-associated protein Csb2